MTRTMPDIRPKQGIHLEMDEEMIIRQKIATNQNCGKLIVLPEFMFFIISLTTMSKPQGSKYAIFPNLWEFLSLIASVLGLGTKATIWGNNKTFYESGFLPIESQSGDVNAVDILKNVVTEAQRKGKLNRFRKGVWRSVLGFWRERSGESYEQLAKACIYDYVEWIRIYKPNTRFMLRELGCVYNEYLRRCSANQKDNAWKYDPFDFNNPEYVKVLNEYLEWRVEQDVRKACIDIVCNFLGEEYRKKSEAKYDELFQNTQFTSNDYQELLKKDLKEWTLQDKALAFSIPFSGFSQDEKYRLYSEVLERIVSNPDRFARNGSKHPNKWIDQFTELGFSFRWMADRKLDDSSKQVLRREKSKKKTFGKLESLVTNLETSELINSVKKEICSDLEEYRESIIGTVEVKGSGQHINKVLSELSHQLPKDAFHQIKSGQVKDEILRELDVLSSDSYESHLMWMTTSKYYPFWGSTGYLCRQRLLPFVPRLRGFIQKHPKMVELFLLMIVSIYSVKNKFSFKRIQQEKTI